MKLLEAAQVVRGNQRFPRAGLDGVCRSTGMNLRLIEACVEEYTNVVGTPASTAGAYRANPFGVQLLLKRSVLCEQPDDESYVRRTLEANIDYPLGRGLVIQPSNGTNTWVGDPLVQSVPLAGLNADQYAAAINAARKLWKSTVLTPDGGPILHLPSSLLPLLKGAGIVELEGGKLVSVWGDPVVVSDGYDLVGTPRIFLSGPLTIYLMDYVSSMQRATRINDSMVEVNTVALIDTEPCAIVRVGTYVA